MKRWLFVIAMLLVPSVPPLCSEAGKEPSFFSQKPLYALIVLDEAATKVLKLVFDESQESGGRYDTIYADLNFNGDLTDDKPIKGTIHPRGSCTFPPVDVNVAYNETGKGVEKPWQFQIQCYRHMWEEQPERSGALDATIRLKDSSGEWEYITGFQFFPAEEPNRAVAAGLEGKPALRLTAKPDEDEEGNIGITADVLAGLSFITCSKNNQLTVAHVEIRDDHGKIVRSEDVASDKLQFG